MKAIIAKYHGPTDSRGSRYTATEPDGKRVTVSYDHSLNSDQMAARAAVALCKKLGWSGTLVQGSSKDGDVFVFLEGAARHEVV